MQIPGRTRPWGRGRTPQAQMAWLGQRQHLWLLEGSVSCLSMSLLKAILYRENHPAPTLLSPLAH